jgi:hypothetical protein
MLFVFRSPARELAPAEKGGGHGTAIIKIYEWPRGDEDVIDLVNRTAIVLASRCSRIWEQDMYCMYLANRTAIVLLGYISLGTDTGDSE